MKTKITIYLLAIGILISGCSTKSQKENTLNISGAFALYPLTVKWAEEYQKLHPEIRINISAGGAGKGMADVLSGTVDMGMFSREIEPEEIEKGIWWAGLCIDAVIPTISADNPYLDEILQKGITRDQFRMIFVTGSIADWGFLTNEANKGIIEVYTRADACGAAGTWASYLDCRQEDLKGIGIYGDPGLAEAVSKNPNAIAYNNTAYVYDINTGQKRPGIEVVPIDINENGTIDPEENFYGSFHSLLAAVSEEVYPYPPARELYFITKGLPVKKSLLDFIRWTLTDGQKYVSDAGYVPEPGEKIVKYLNKTY